MGLCPETPYDDDDDDAQEEHLAACYCYCPLPITSPHSPLPPPPCTQEHLFQDLAAGDKEWKVLLLR